MPKSILSSFKEDIRKYKKGFQNPESGSGSISSLLNICKVHILLKL